MSDNCDFKGENTIYFYPDVRSAIIGTFDDKSQLKSGHVTELIGVDKDAASNPKPVFLGPNTEGPLFHLDISTKDCISKSPQVPDPYEELFVFVDQSTIPDAGEGLFAKLDVEESTVISFYNGVRYDTCDTTLQFDNSPYKISFTEDYDLDIPVTMVNLEKYRATLGHKVCHSFTPNCEFDNFQHPRFGLIKCVVTLRPISQGEELTVHYKYELFYAPAW